MMPKNGFKHHSGLSVVVCTYERHQLLQQTLDCLLRQNVSSLPSYEIIVIDNSRDNTKATKMAAVYKHEQLISYLFLDQPGLSHARNVGLYVAQYSVVAYVDDDVVVPPTWAEAIFSAFTDSQQQVAMVGGRVSLRWIEPRPDWLHDRLLGYLGQFDLGSFNRSLRANEHPVGCNMAFDRDSLLDIGGFDKNLGRMGGDENLLSNEELQVGMKFRNLGLNLIYAPEAGLEHIVAGPRLAMKWFRQRIFWQAISDAVIGGPRLKALKLRARLRQLVLPSIRAALSIRQKPHSATEFYLELESLYDYKLLETLRTKNKEQRTKIP